jgi:SAM-dependent methyltransferase
VRCDCCGSESWHELFSENDVHLGQCPTCDLLYIKEMPAPDNRMTEIEEGHYAGSLEMLSAARQLEGERIMEARFQSFVDLGQQHVSTGRWLDIGCGTGLLLQLAQRAGFEPEGLELNDDRRRTAEQVGGFTVHGVPVEDAGLPDDSFDVISMINVFSHLISPAQTFRELGRLLRPGGIVVMATGEMTAGVAKSHMLTWNLGDHLYFLGERTMDEYADRIGFEVAHHTRRWLPDEMFSREWLRSLGRDRRKNAIKTAIDKTPGGLKLLRAVMLRRQANSKAHSGVFVLRFDA